MTTMLHWDPKNRGDCPNAVEHDAFTDLASHALLAVDCPTCLKSVEFRLDVIEKYEVSFRNGIRCVKARQHPLTHVGIQLLEELPKDTVVAHYISLGKITAETMIANLEEGTDVGRQWIADLLRVSRDMLSRQARRGG